MTQIARDSALNINWENALCTINSLHLGHCLHSVKYLLLEFPQLSLKHIFQEFNCLVNALSTQGLSALEDSIFQDYWISDTPLQEDHMDLY